MAGSRRRVPAARLATPDLDAGELDATFQQLALLESASEAIVSIPLGLLAFIWWIRRIRSGRPEAVAAPDADPN